MSRTRGRPRSNLARSVVPALFGLAAAFAALSAAKSIAHAAVHPGMRAWLLADYDVLRAGVAAAFAICTIRRAEPRRRTRDPIAYLACGAAMATVLLFSAPGGGTPDGIVIAGEAISVASYVWLLASVLALGRCFGVLPEARGLVTRGPYGLVRHPVYLGEISACAGLAIASPSLRSAAALTGVVLSQSVRMRLEERALADAFSDYTDYAASTPRVLPRLTPRRRGTGAAGVAVPERARLSAEPSRQAHGKPTRSSNPTPTFLLSSEAADARSVSR